MAKNKPLIQSSKRNKISGPQIHLMNGGGALKGMGESFEINAFSGAATLNIPIFCTSCRNFEPALTITYNSNSGNDIFGLGFSTSHSYIARRTEQTIPQYNDSDIFVLNGEILVPVDNSTSQKVVDNQAYSVTRYQPRFESDFSKIELWESENNVDDVFWRLANKENINFIYGQSNQAKITDPNNNAHTFSWLLEAAYDAKGNAQYYTYKQEDLDNIPNVIYEINRVQNANKYPQKIAYGNYTPFIPVDNVSINNISDLKWHFEIVFDYGEYNVTSINDHIYIPQNKWLNREDPFSHYKSGFEKRTHRLCRNILLFHLFEEEFGQEPILTHSTNFKYNESASNSSLIAIQSTGWRYYANNPSGKLYISESLPALELSYTPFNPTNYAFEPLTDNNGQSLPNFSGQGNSNFIDLYRAGVPGVLSQGGGSFNFYSPTKTNSEEKSPITYQLLSDPLTLPLGHGQNPYLKFEDVAANGSLELLNTKALECGYYTINPDRSWGNFTSFNNFPTDYYSPHNQFVNISGNGQSDIVSFQEDLTEYSIANGYDGYLLPQTVNRINGLPTTVLASREEIVLFADILGSGQKHQLRITNGKIECWPNLGYGQLGEKIELENVPYFDEFDINRIHLADIDGSGALDFIYIYPDKVEIYMNQAGNAFALAPLIIPLPKNYYSPEQIQFGDIYGNGNACLVFTDDDPAPNQWVYDFWGGCKPYLINNIINNIGAQTTLSYVSSTQFYLQDKQSGNPWITTLPYPMQVVQQIIYEDEISQNKLVNTFSYHHGYYDSIDCEFRGFGRIERLDVETPIQNKAAHKNNNALFDDGYYVAPSLTKIWYHTGAWSLPIPLTDYFEQEYFQGDHQAYSMPAIIFNENLISDPSTNIQAFSALQGKVLRTEIYGFNETTIESVPYAASQTNYEVKFLQGKGSFAYGIFYTSQREAISYHYELSATDPNVSHDFILERDDYGDVTRSCIINYPRRPDILNTLPDQNVLRVKCDTISYFSPLDEDNVYIIGLQNEEKSYEITQLVYSPKQLYFYFDDIDNQINQALSNTSPSGPIAELLIWNRYNYQQDNTGKITPQILLNNNENAVFSDTFINTLFAGKPFPKGLSDFLINQGGYYLEATSKYWWNPGISMGYSDLAHFYRLTSVTDPFYTKSSSRSGSENLYSYDQYDLLISSVTTQSRDKDVLPSTVTVLKTDYHTLQACQYQDANGTISEILLSPLGLVIATSRYGSEYQGDAIKPIGFTPLPLTENSWPQPSSLEDLITNADQFLRGASTFYYYDFYNWINNKQPIYNIELSAQEYPVSQSPNVPVGEIQMFMQFTDGFDRIVQNKKRIESGNAFLFDAQGNPIIGPDGKIKQGFVDLRWLTSGRVEYNNKGNPFKQYEPYFTSTFCYIDDKALNTFGVANLLFYDPLNRPMSVVRPKGIFKNAFFTKVEFTAWTEVLFDDNDTVKDSPYYQYYIASGQGSLPIYDKDALLKAAHFYNTPTTHIFDNLGNTIQSISTFEDGSSQSNYASYNLLSENLWSADSRLFDLGHKNFQSTYDMSGLVLYSISVDAGQRYALYDVFGKSIYYLDGRGLLVTSGYDSFHRLAQVNIEGNGIVTNQTTERLIYGDSLDGQGKTVYPDIAGRNLRGKLCVIYDEASRKEVPYFTLLGKPLTAQQQIRISYKNEADWNASLTANWSWQNLFDLLKGDVDSALFLDSYQYDALSRIVTNVDPDGNNCAYQYYVSDKLNQASGISKDSTPYARVSDISYNEHRDREQVTYGIQKTAALLNINYAYDPDNFNLINITSERLSDKKLLQNINYYHDPVDNITHVENLVVDFLLPSSTNVTNVTPDYDYTYDAIYRLTQSQGRAIVNYSSENEENGSYQAFFPTGLMENYLYKYSYDKGNNLYHIQYITNNTVRWSRTLTVSSESNQAIELPSLNSDPISKYFDPNGNQISMCSNTITWNYRDNIASIVLNNAPSENVSKTQYFTYNNSGRRIRAVTETTLANGATAIDETLYLNKLIIKRVYQNQTLINELHKTRFFDDNTCVAEKLTWVAGNPPAGITSPQIRFQLDNMLDSSLLEVDSQSQVISYEEYAAFGATTYAWSLNQPEIDLKDFRYQSKERDQQNGLYYFGARYYSPWARRWMSPDPTGAVDGLNLYTFAGNNPISFHDYSGLCKGKRKKPGADPSDGDGSSSSSSSSSSSGPKRSTRSSSSKEEIESAQNELDDMLNAKKEESNKKRKITLKKQADESPAAIPVPLGGSNVEYHYRHTSKSKVTKAIGMPFGLQAKRQLRNNVENRRPAFGEHLGLYFTADVPLSINVGEVFDKRVFEVRRGHDVVLDRTVTKTIKGKSVISPAYVDSPYTDLASNADKIVQNLQTTDSATYKNDAAARSRVSRDIQRVGGGKSVKGKYTFQEWINLSEFAGVIRIDKARAPKATHYIDEVLHDHGKSFGSRYAGPTPSYYGTGDGSVQIDGKAVLRGAAALRALGEEHGKADETDYESDPDA